MRDRCRLKLIAPRLVGLEAAGSLQAAGGGEAALHDLIAACAPHTSCKPLYIAEDHGESTAASAVIRPRAVQRNIPN